MLTAELDAAVSWPNGVKLQGLVKMNYLANKDPWLVHLTFVVAEARDDLEVERTTLMRAGQQIDAPAKWIGEAGTPFRMGVGSDFVRMRVTDPSSGTWADFDIRRKEMTRFLRQTIDAADYQTERAALDAYINEALGTL
jgi:hypothetical protein